MKRLLLPALTSRHQRGFFRATALLCSAALVVASIVTAQQAKAQQADGSVNHYERAVSLEAGQRLALGISDPTGSLQPGGTWTSEFGAVTASGIYTAPHFTPPEGLDRLDYTDPSNDDVWINIRILPNPAIPGSAKTCFVVFDFLHGNSTYKGGQTAQAQLIAPKEPLTAAAKTIVVLPGETPAPPLKIVASASLKTRKVRGRSVLMLPAIRGGGDATAAVYARPLDGIPQIVTLLPDVGPPTGPATSGEVSVDGPISITSTPDKSIVDLAVGTAGVEITDNANDVLMRHKEDFHVQGQSYNWKRTYLRYVYTRVHKKWVLESVLHCDALTLSWITSPPEAVVAEGYPQNNQPFLPYGPDACHD